MIIINFINWFTVAIVETRFSGWLERQENFTDGNWLIDLNHNFSVGHIIFNMILILIMIVTILRCIFIIVDVEGLAIMYS